MTKLYLSELKTQSVPRSKHYASVIKPDKLMLFLVNDQIDALFFNVFHASTCFEQQVLIIRRTNLYRYIVWYNTLWWVTLTHQSVLYHMMY
jgi:hypothetical protein